MQDSDEREDVLPEGDPEKIADAFRQTMLSVSVEQIVLARSRNKKIALCAEHLVEYYSDFSDLVLIANVLQGAKIERPQDLSNVGVHIRVDEIRENEKVSFEEAVERYASRANMSVSAVKKAITLANKNI